MVQFLRQPQNTEIEKKTLNSSNAKIYKTKQTPIQSANSIRFIKTKNDKSVKHQLLFIHWCDCMCFNDIGKNFIPSKKMHLMRTKKKFTCRHKEKSSHSEQWTVTPTISSWQFVQEYFANNSVNNLFICYGQLMKNSTKIFSLLTRSHFTFLPFLYGYDASIIISSVAL